MTRGPFLSVNGDDDGRAWIVFRLEELLQPPMVFGTKHKHRPTQFLLNFPERFHSCSCSLCCARARSRQKVHPTYVVVTPRRAPLLLLPLTCDHGGGGGEGGIRGSFKIYRHTRVPVFLGVLNSASVPQTGGIPSIFFFFLDQSGGAFV